MSIYFYASITSEFDNQTPDLHYVSESEELTCKTLFALRFNTFRNIYGCKILKEAYEKALKNNTKEAKDFLSYCLDTNETLDSFNKVEEKDIYILIDRIIQHIENAKQLEFILNFIFEYQYCLFYFSKINTHSIEDLKNDLKNKYINN